MLVPKEGVSDVCLSLVKVGLSLIGDHLLRSCGHTSWTVRKSAIAAIGFWTMLKTIRA